MEAVTADLCDEYGDDVAVCALQFRMFGNRRCFSGRAATVQVDRTHQLVRDAVAEPGDGRVLVIDALGATDCAMLGDQLAAKAVANNWVGLIVHGAVRDVDAMAAIDLGVRALATTARRADQVTINGIRGAPVSFGGVTFHPDDWVFADADAVIVARRPLRR